MQQLASHGIHLRIEIVGVIALLIHEEERASAWYQNTMHLSQQGRLPFQWNAIQQLQTEHRIAAV